MAVRKLGLTAEERREITLRRVTSVFAERGYAAATMAELAKASGVSAALLYKHFHSKEGLYQAVVAKKLAGITAGVAEIDASKEPDERAFFLAVSTRIFEAIRSDPDFFRLLLFSDLEQGNLSQTWHRERTQKGIVLLRRFIEDRITAGVFRPLDAEAAARGFVAMMFQQAAVTHVFRADAVEPIADERIIATLTDIFLRGLLSEERDR